MSLIIYIGRRFSVADVFKIGTQTTDQSVNSVEKKKRKKKETLRYELIGIILVFLRRMCVHVCV